jgi:hypothetical protein
MNYSSLTALISPHIWIPTQLSRLSLVPHVANTLLTDLANVLQNDEPESVYTPLFLVI